MPGLRPVLSMILLVACSSPDTAVPDAPPDVPLPPPDAPPNTVTGRLVTRYHSASGVVEIPDDLSTRTIRAMIVDASEPSGYRTVIGTGSADGTFSIPDVPDGAPYLLRLNRAYFATTQHHITEVFDAPRRAVPPPVLVTAPTTINFNVSNMSPFQRGPEDRFSWIEVDSFALNYAGSTTSPPNNATSLAGPYTWNLGSSPYGYPLAIPEVAHGDDLTLSHLQEARVVTPSRRRQRVSRILDSFRPHDFAIANGVTSPVTGSWVPTPANKTMSASVVRGQYDSAYPSDTRMDGLYVTLLAHPVAAIVPDQATVFDVTFDDWSRTDLPTETASFSYGDPYPDDWARTLAVVYLRNRRLRAPGASSSTTLYARNMRYSRYTGGTPSTTPAVQPPANVAIAGGNANAGGVIAFDGTAPVSVTWSAVDQADVYSVVPYRVYRNGSATRLSSVGIFYTADTHLDVPAEVFTGGEFFAFVVSAQHDPRYANGQLGYYSLPYYSADMSTALFRLSATCGNGVVDPGEDCDTAGATAACDADCTLPICGDGLRNTAAGEQCDAGGDTDGCDANCTPSQCGDGYVNPAIEDCDDGDAIDTHNGCSAGCRFNNACGNGTVQSAAEECDGGGVDTATCNYNCTSPRCGDGHRNVLAGEQCDDGNLDNTDGCDTSCRTH